MEIAADYDVLIVGTGHGGSQAAIALRQYGYAGTIALIGAEAEWPYERPPLSKDYLAGTRAADRLQIRPPAFWAEKRIELLLGDPVVVVKSAARQVETSRKARYNYGKLIWATGGRARRLTCSGHDLRGVHTVRDRVDVDALRAEIAEGKRVVIVGGGYIGLEVAAALTKIGCPVTLLEAQERLLARVAGDALSSFFESEHRARGVDIRLGSVVECVEEHAGRVAGVRLADGVVIPCDIVVVGIGIVPNVEVLRAAGAEGGNGVDVDADCRTSLPQVFAIGDAAAQHSDFAAGQRVRIESVQNAHDQAVIVARGLTNGVRPAATPPWFWSNQYDIKLQTVGLSIGQDKAVVRGDPSRPGFSIIYLADGKVIALDCINATKDYVQGRRLVAEGLKVDVDRLADLSAPLSSIT